MPESFELRPYESNNSFVWDEFLRKARNADFMHTRKFLNYHRDNIEDMSLMFYKNNELIAVFPASIHDNSIVISHGGASYGGFCFSPKYGGEALVELANLAIQYYRKNRIRKLIIKPKPSIYSEPTGSEDLYAWWRNGAYVSRVDLSNVLEIRKMSLSQRRLRALKNAETFLKDYQISFGHDTLQASYQICRENLKTYRSVEPIHTLSDLQYLSNNFNKNILSGILESKGEVLAGIIFFNNQNASIVQYWGSSDLGRKHNILDLLVMAAIEQVRDQGLTWFVPGISTSSQGQIVDVGIYEYKRSLGAGTISVPTLCIDL